MNYHARATIIAHFKRGDINEDWYCTKNEIDAAIAKMKAH